MFYINVKTIKKHAMFVYVIFKNNFSKFVKNVYAKATRELALPFLINFNIIYILENVLNYYLLHYPSFPKIYS